MALKAQHVDFLLSENAAIAGGTATFYTAGSSHADADKKAIWQDRNKTTPAANPVTLDAVKGTATVFADGVYDVVLKNAAGVVAATLSNIEGLSIQAVTDALSTRVDGRVMFVEDYAALAALTGVTSGTQAQAAGRTTAGDGGGGLFRWDSSNLSSSVSADTSAGIYVPPAASPTGSSGAWVRMVQPHYYDVAWFPGSSLNAKWDAIKPLLANNVGYTLQIGAPATSDLAGISFQGKKAWKLTAPLIFGDDQNYGTILAKWPIVATAAMDAMVIFGAVGAAKTEHYLIPYGFDLWGSDTAVNKSGAGVWINNCAHVNAGPIYVHYTDIPVKISPDAIEVNHIELGDIYAAYHNGPVVEIMGSNPTALATTPLVTGVRIGNVYNNGAIPTATLNETTVRIKGNVRGVVIDTIYEQPTTAIGLLGSTLASLIVETDSTTGGRSPLAGSIGRIINTSSAIPSNAILTRDNTAGVALKVSGFDFGPVRSFDGTSGTNYIITLGYIRNSNQYGGSYFASSGAFGTIVVESTASGINLVNVDKSKVTNSGLNTTINFEYGTVSATWTPGAISAGATATTDVVIAGSTSANIPIIGMGGDKKGCILAVRYIGSSTWRASLTNPSSGSVTPEAAPVLILLH